MAEGEEVLRAKITATDDSSRVIAAITAQTEKLTHALAHLGHQAEHTHHEHGHAFFGMSEHVKILGEHYHGLSLSMGEVGKTTSELLPAFAAFGAAGSLVGLFETVEHVSEAQAELAHTAGIIGVTSAQLQQLNFVAKMTDTSVEAMHTGLEKLNKVIAEAAAGKNKDAAALFGHLGISLRDSNGHLKSSADLLPQVANAIQHTGDAAMRARMAMALMGRGGQEMIPLLAGGAEKINELSKESRKLNFTPDDSQRENLLKYADAMKELHSSVQGFTDNLGADLAPVLLPIVDHAKEWVLAHRAGIANFVAGRLSIIGQWAEAGGIERVETTVEHFSGTIDHVVEAMGGWGRAAELLAGIMVVKGALFLVEPIMKTIELSTAIGKLSIKLGTELVSAWLNVGNAAEAAAVKEEAASLAGHHGAAEAGVAAAAGRIGLKALALGAVIPLAGGYIAHESDSEDGIGKWVDAHVPGAGAFDDWVSRHTFGDNGREGGRITQAQRDQERYADQLQDAAVDADSGNWMLPHQTSLQPKPEPETWHGWSLPFAADASGRTTLPEIDQGSSGGRMPDGRVQVDVNLTNAPPGTTATATSTGQGLGGPRVNVGHAWGGSDLLAPAF